VSLFPFVIIVVVVTLLTLNRRDVPALLVDFGMPSSVIFAPVYFHALVIALFTSLLAPFGGFLASAVKRAFKIKDFGEVIPGHGGVTDRMDCQFLAGAKERESATYSFVFFRFFDSCRGAGTFTFVWLMTFVLRRRTALQLVLERIVMLDADALQQVPHLVFCVFVFFCDDLVV
jgi:hypothetical protein